MDHSYSDIRSKINFFQPSDRQNFANALGQTCINDLRLRRKQTFDAMQCLSSCWVLFLFEIHFTMHPKKVGISTVSKDLTQCLSSCWVVCLFVHRSVTNLSPPRKLDLSKDLYFTELNPLLIDRQ